MHPGSERLTHTNLLFLNGYVVEAVAAPGAVSEEADEPAEYGRSRRALRPIESSRSAATA